MSKTHSAETMTADELRAAARDARQSSAESWQRSDTDGFLSQWASDANAREYDARAELVDNGGVAEFPALFTVDGELVAAKLIDTRYGSRWALLASDDPRSRYVGFFGESYAASETRRRATNARKGFYVGTVKAPAYVKLSGNGYSLSPRLFRADGGFSRDVEIVDNGQS